MCGRNLLGKQYGDHIRRYGQGRTLPFQVVPLLLEFLLRK